MNNEIEDLRQAILHLVKAVEIMGDEVNENRIITILNSKTIEALQQRLQIVEKENAKLKEELTQISLIN